MKQVNRGVLFVAVLVLGVLAGLSGSRAEDGVIRIGTEGTWKPFSYKDAAGNLVGFEVEMVRAACEKAKLTCELSVIPYENLIPSLQEEKIDAAASGFRITEKRKKVVDFATPYYKQTITFSSCKHKDLKDNSPEALKGMSVGVQVGSNNLDFLKKRYDVLDIRTYKNVDDVYADLASGRLDLAYGGKPTAYDFLQSEKGKGCVFVGEVITDAEFYAEPTAMIVRKGDNATNEKLSAGVKAILEDGTADKINAKYWPFSVIYKGPSN